MTHRVILAAAAVLVAVLASCASDPQDPPAKGPAPGGNAVARAPSSPQPPPATQPQGPDRLEQHWVQDWQIRGIMQRIRHGSGDIWPKGLPDDPEKPPTTQAVEQAFKDAGVLARSLSQAASELPRLIENKPLPPDARSGFVAQAERLRDQAAELQGHAEGRRIEGMQRTLDAINWTCFDCHNRYRDLTRVLDAGRAELDRQPQELWNELTRPGLAVTRGSP